MPLAATPAGPTDRATRHQYLPLSTYFTYLLNLTYFEYQRFFLQYLSNITSSELWRLDTLAALDYKVPLWLIFKSKRSKAMLHNPAHQMEMIDHNIEDSK